MRNTSFVGVMKTGLCDSASPKWGSGFGFQGRLSFLASSGHCPVPVLCTKTGASVPSTVSPMRLPGKGDQDQPCRPKGAGTPGGGKGAAALSLTPREPATADRPGLAIDVTEHLLRVTLSFLPH